MYVACHHTGTIAEASQKDLGHAFRVIGCQ